jgi:hypothetical protein
MADLAQSKPARKLQVFLCHATEDKPVVRTIYQKLRSYNIQPWLDERDLLPGERWQLSISEVIRKCDLVLICLSRTFLAKVGHGHYEVREVLEEAKRRPLDAIYYIPYRLDDCEVPFYLAGIHYMSNFVPEDFDKLLTACQRERQRLMMTQSIEIEPIFKVADAAVQPPSTVPSDQDQTPRQAPNVPPQEAPTVYRQRRVNDAAPQQASDIYRMRGEVEVQAAQKPAPEERNRRLNIRFGDPFPETWNVPRGHHSYFTGRAAVLDKLFNTFSVGSGAGMHPPQAITGLGGMGKTQVVAEYAYRFRDAYQAVLWVRADTQENLRADFAAIATLLKRPQEMLQDETSLIQTMGEWFRSESGWLLILDNVDNPELVDPFLPRAQRGHILATTRDGAVGSWMDRPLRLEELETDAGALCILRRASQLTEQQQLLDAPPARVKAARQLSEMMRGLPLALEQIGAYIDDTDCGVPGYLELYDEFGTELRTRSSGTVREYSETVTSVWKLSMRSVAHKDPAAAELLYLCAFLAPERIPDQVVLNAAPVLGPVLGPVAGNKFLFNHVISVLKKYSLLHREVNRDTEARTLWIHRVMQAVLIDEMDERTQRLWAERAVRTIERSFESESLPDPWSLLQAHARKCRQLINQWRMTFPEAKRLLQWIAKFEQQERS